MKLSGHRMRIKFDTDPLAVEQNNYLAKIINIYIVYDLDTWPKDPTNNFKFKNCLVGATDIVKNSDKEKCVYSGYGITFDSADFWGLDNDTAINVIIFGVDNSSSSHSDNRKNNFLIWGKGPTFRINGNLGSPEKILVLILLRQTQNFVWVYIIMVITNICLLMEKKFLSLKPAMKI